METTEVDGAVGLGEARPVRIGRVEADMFCSGCLYNLHGLDVVRDERLEIAVVRCPECGKFHPAGMATGAGRVWLHRLARMLIAVWVGFILLAIALGVTAFLIMDCVELDAFVRHEWTQAGPGVPGVMTLRPMTSGDFPSFGSYLMVRGIIGGLGLAFGWLLGAFFPVFLWHVKRRAWFGLALLLPTCSAMFIYEMYMADMARRAIGDVSCVWDAMMLQWVLQSGGVAAGIVMGRAVARVVLRAVLTRKLLQYVQFLWEVDGKLAPGVKEATAPSEG